MRNYFIFSALILFLVVRTVFSQTMFYGQKSEKIVIGETIEIYSKVLNEKRKILVHLPQTAPDEFSNKPKYPVVFVLDGEVLFQTTVAVTELLSGGSGNFAYPKMIVVGINNTDRTRDLTPTRSSDESVMPAFLLANSGGGKNFAAFLEKELLPFINEKYPAAPYKILIGHSFGGLTAIDNLLGESKLFNSYVAIDPSLWWDKQNFLKQAKKDFSKADVANKSLYLAIANSTNNKLTLENVVKDTNPNSLPMRSILEFDEFVKRQNSNLIYKSKYYGDYDHGAVSFVAIYDALPFLFDFYAINFPFQDFFNPNYKNDAVLENHYRETSKRMGYQIMPPGEFVDALAHQLMDSKQFDRAYKFLRLNLENYPNSYKPIEAMGDYFSATNDKSKALEFYLKALTLKNDANIRLKIQKLKTGREE